MILISDQSGSHDVLDERVEHTAHMISGNEITRTTGEQCALTAAFALDVSHNDDVLALTRASSHSCLFKSREVLRRAFMRSNLVGAERSWQPTNLRLERGTQLVPQYALRGCPSMLARHHSEEGPPDEGLDRALINLLAKCCQARGSDPGCSMVACTRRRSASS
jgi:hypothetical protein